MKRSICMVGLISLSFAAVTHGQDWQQIGPEPIQGEGFSNLSYASAAGSVTGIAIDPSGSQDSTIYIATSAGGVWKLANESPTWASKSKGMPILFMGAIALDPSNPSTVYAGIGGPWCCFSGGGIYRSTDGADDWKLLDPNGIFTNVNISAIVLPASGTLLLGTNNGLYKSVDSGENFGNNSPQFNNGNPIAVATPQGSITKGNISDLELDTATRTTVYVAIDNEGLYKSTDSGTSFPASGKLFSQASFPPLIQGTGDVFIKIAQSTRPDNKTMYAFLCVGAEVRGEPCVLLKSVTGGGSWNPLSLTGIQINQQDYDQIVGVDPQDANGVYIGLRQIYYASDGGASGFSSANQIDVNGAHTDDHVITFSPASHFNFPPPTPFFLGTDGGVASTAAQGSAPGSQWDFLNEGLATALLYGMDMGRGSSGNNVYSYGASQDNGTFVRTPGLMDNRWQFQCCGDSGSVAVDPANPQHAITLNDGGLTCTTNAQNWSSCGNLPPKTPGLGLVSFDPSGGVAYAATGSQLFQSQNNAQTFLPMHTFPQSITVISQTKGKQNILWIGQSDGTIQWTNGALQGPAALWTKVVVHGAPSGQGVTGIAIDPEDSSTVVAVYPGFSGSAEPPEHVFLTTDGGTKWKNIGGTPDGGDNNLPDLPLYAVVIIGSTTPHTIVVGSDAGVLQTADLGNSWQVLGTGLPNVQVTALALDAGANPPLLRASTFGRSVFELQGLGTSLSCGRSGGPCCAGNKCASAGLLCQFGTCGACGGSGELCCAGNRCTAAGLVCQAGACGAQDVLTAIPGSLFVQEGDGTTGANAALTNLSASGYWASNANVAPSLAYKVIQVQPGVALPPPGAMPPGISRTITNDINPPTVKFTASFSSAAPAGTNAATGTYTIAITGTIGQLQATALVHLTVTACQPVTCAASGWTCGSFDNGCGQNASCGTCSSGKSCLAGFCYATCNKLCEPPEFLNPIACSCESCPCGYLTVNGHRICNVCKPETP